MKNSTNRSFLPKDKPKSWVILTIAGLFGLLVAAPLMMLGAHFSVNFLLGFGKALFISCFILCAIMWLYYMAGMLSGRYRNLENKNWHDQVW